MRPFKGEINWGIVEQMYSELTVILAVIKYSGPTVTRQITFILGELYLSEKLKMIRLIPNAMEYFHHDDFLSL